MFMSVGQWPKCRLLGLITGFVGFPVWAVNIIPTTNTGVLANHLLPGSTVRGVIGGGQVGTFTGLSLTDPNGIQQIISQGIVLSSGNLDGLPITNTQGRYGTNLGGAGDNIFDAFPIHGRGQSFDAARIDLRFDIPEGMNVVHASFIYASEEYPEFAGTQYADGFAFVRNSGELFTPGGTPIQKSEVNYAVLPDRTPVSLMDVSSTIQFYPNYPSQLGVPLVDLEFDGFTSIIEVFAPVDPARGQENFYFVVADTGDGILDSAVFMTGLDFLFIPDFLPFVSSMKLGPLPAAFSPAVVPSAVVPLPPALWLLGTGLLALAGRGRFAGYLA